MNKALLIERVRDVYGNELTAAQAVEAVLDSIVREVVEGNSVRLTGFGTLDSIRLNERLGRDPRNGDRVHVPSTLRVRFRAGQSFLDLLNGRKLLPESGSSIKKAPKGSVAVK